MHRVARAAVGAQLREHRDVRARCKRPQATRLVGFRRMRSRIAEPPKTNELRSNEYRVAVLQTVRTIGKDPRAIARSEVAHEEHAIAHRDLSVHRAQKNVFRKADVAFVASEGGLAAIERERFLHLAGFVEEREFWPRSRATGRECCGAALLWRRAPVDTRSAVRAERQRRIDRFSTAHASLHGGCTSLWHRRRRHSRIGHSLRGANRLYTGRTFSVRARRLRQRGHRDDSCSTLDHRLAAVDAELRLLIILTATEAAAIHSIISDSACDNWRRSAGWSFCPKRAEYRPGFG